MTVTTIHYPDTKQMPIPYHRRTVAFGGSCAAFLHVDWDTERTRLLGALLIIDGQGRPLEFAHTDLRVPSGFLWPEEQVWMHGTIEVAHALFEACQRKPELLVCRANLGEAEFLRNEIAPVIPFAVVELLEDRQVSWSWLGTPPGATHPAQLLQKDLISRGYSLEPFERVVKGLREIYPDSVANDLETR